MKRVAVLISGRGSNLRSLIRESGEEYDVSLVVSNQYDAPGLLHTKDYCRPYVVIPHESRVNFARELQYALNGFKIDLVCLAGFMKILDADFADRWSERMLNIHPSLLPKYRGLHPQRRALEAGDSVAGCTVHLVTSEVDNGLILGQDIVFVRPDDSVESLSARILEREHILYPNVLKAYIRSGV